ncbi:VWA domain-containing protein [Candidatus Saccharibacteria bacterium]|nr:VWA domain-containing protein [Candidatus Saccharibacteria bacterium]
MGVSLAKIEMEAPHLVQAFELTRAVSLEKGLDPENSTAAVMATFDVSYSNESGGNRNYSSGQMQRIGDLVLAAGFTFDDDGEVPFSYFSHDVRDKGSITPRESRGFVERTWASELKRSNGTRYLEALDWIVDTAGYSGVNLGRSNEPLRVRATAEYPAFAIFATDGEPNDHEDRIKERLVRMSQLPIFVQFVGVGEHDFDFLETLDEMGGRLIDNAHFFDAKKVLDKAPDAEKRRFFGLLKAKKQPSSSADAQERVLNAMLHEFPQYYRKARAIGLIATH